MMKSTKIRYSTHAFLLVLGLLISISAEAQSSASKQKPRVGDGRKSGFLYRAALGGTYGSAHEGGMMPFDISGFGFAGSLAVGRFIFENFAFHVDSFGSYLLNPSVEFQDVEGTLNGEMAHIGIGVGATYYFMPINIYLAGSFGAGIAQLSGGGVLGSTDIGFAGNLLIGKEWWLSEDWGLGAGGQMFFMSLPDDDSNTLVVFNGSLLVSVSYNSNGRPPISKSTVSSPSPTGQKPFTPDEKEDEESAAASSDLNEQEEISLLKGTDESTEEESTELFHPEEVVQEEESTASRELPELTMRIVKGRGWTMKVPAEWKEQEASSSILLHVREPKLTSSSFATIKVEVELIMGKVSDYLKKRLESYPTADVLQHHGQTVAGFEGIVMEVKTGEKPSKRSLVYNTSDGAGGYILSCTTDEAVFEKIRPLCVRSLESFRFVSTHSIK